MKYRVLTKKLEALGCTLDRASGSTSHKIWHTPGGKAIVISGKYRNGDVTAGILGVIKRILKAEGLSLEDT